MKKMIILLCVVFSITIQAQQRIMVDMSAPADLKGIRSHVVNSNAKPRKVDGLSSIQRAVGYVVDNNPDSITVKGALVGTAGTFPVGAEITEEMLQPYVGCKVVGIRVAAAQSLGKSNLFLQPIGSDGMALTDGINKSQRIYEGWNNVFFNGDTAWEIQEGQSVLFGFDYTETEAMVEAKTGGLCTVGESNGNDFLIYSDFGSGLAWYRISNLGALCVQLIVDVSNLPEKALQLLYLDTGFRYKKAGENVELYVVAGNAGRTDVNSFKLVCQIDDMQPETFEYQESIREQANSHKQPMLSLPSDIAVGQHEITVSVLPEQDTETTGNHDSETVIFYVYDKSFQKHKNYVEQYNTQNSYMASITNPIFNKVANTNDAMALVNVYDEGSPLAINEANYLHDLYAYTVPSFTINRSYFPGEDYIAYDVNYYAEQYASLVPGIINDLIDQDLQFPAFATVELSPTYNAETRQLYVDVSGELVDGALGILGTPAITLLLTENNVPSKQVVVNSITGKITTQQNYSHQHVLRKYVTSPLGNMVEVNGNQYQAHFSTILDQDWKIEDMSLVGFVTRAADEVNDANVMQMDVTNCNSVTLSELSSIKGIDANDDYVAEWFSINGQRVSSMEVKPGIYLVRKGSSTKKIVVR